MFVGRYYQTLDKKARAYKSITKVLVVDFFVFITAFWDETNDKDNISALILAARIEADR